MNQSFNNLNINPRNDEINYENSYDSNIRYKLPQLNELNSQKSINGIKIHQISTPKSNKLINSNMNTFYHNSNKLNELKDKSINLRQNSPNQKDNDILKSRMKFYNKQNNNFNKTSQEIRSKSTIKQKNYNEQSKSNNFSDIYQLINKMEEQVKQINNIEDINQVAQSENFLNNMSKIYNTSLSLNEVKTMNFKDQIYLIKNRSNLNSKIDKVNIMDAILEDEDVKNNIIRYIKTMKIDKLENLTNKDAKPFLIKYISWLRKEMTNKFIRTGIKTSLITPTNTNVNYLNQNQSKIQLINNPIDTDKNKKNDISIQLSDLQVKNKNQINQLNTNQQNDNFKVSISNKQSGLD